MSKRLPIIIAIATAIAGIAFLGAVIVLAPDDQSAYQVAEQFINAAGTGDDATAFPLLSDELQTYVTENCPDASVSACILAYTPPEWGTLLHDEAAVFRRAEPDGDDAFNVQIVATYEEGQGFAGVCIYHRVEEVAPDDWRIAGWSGFISCDEPNSGIQGLMRADAPNRLP